VENYMTLSSSVSAAIVAEDMEKPQPMARDEALTLNATPPRQEPSKKLVGPDLSGFIGADLWTVGKYER